MPRRRSVVRSLLLAMLATGLLMGLAFPLVVGPFAEFRPGARLAFSLLCVGAGLVVGGLNFSLVRFFLLRPVRSVSGELAALATGRGTRGGRVTLDSDDDLGRLVERFNGLLDLLREATRDIIGVGETFAREAEQAGTLVRATAAGSSRRTQVVEGTVTLHESVRGELRSVGDVLTRLSASARETTAAVAQQLEQVEASERQAAGLRTQSERTAEGLARIARAAQRTSASVGELSTALTGAAASMSQMDASVREVERTIAASTAIAERVADDAAQGEAAAGSTHGSMERIHSSVEEALAAIRSFTESAAGIAAVTQVIEEVTEQTNLLALNAAIIAAQAGEHGAGFAVVAGQIKKLADRTASSTREISALVDGFREQAGESLESMSRSRTLVQEGVALSRRAAEALGRIRENTSSSLEQAQQLGAAAGEISATAHHIAGTVEAIAGRSLEISEATREQERALEELGDAARATRESAAAIAAAAQNQLAAARRIRSQAEGVGGLVETSGAAIFRGLEQTELLSTTVETARDLDAREREGLARLERAAEVLGVQAARLLAGIERIRPDAGGDGRHRPGGGTA